MIRHRPGLASVYTDGDKPPKNAPPPPKPTAQEFLPVEDAMAAARARQEFLNPPATPVLDTPPVGPDQPAEHPELFPSSDKDLLK